jgi:hypothetical protein
MDFKIWINEKTNRKFRKRTKSPNVSPIFNPIKTLMGENMTFVDYDDESVTEKVEVIETEIVDSKYNTQNYISSCLYLTVFYFGQRNHKYVKNQATFSQLFFGKAHTVH